VNEYKYLGVYFSRSLKFNYHINSYVKENADHKLNYCIRILVLYIIDRLPDFENVHNMQLFVGS
jgi:hypothetical protein